MVQLLHSITQHGLWSLECNVRGHGNEVNNGVPSLVGLPRL